MRPALWLCSCTLLLLACDRTPATTQTPGQANAGSSIAEATSKPSEPTWTKVAVDEQKICAIDELARTWCWGFDLSAQFDALESGVELGAAPFPVWMPPLRDVASTKMGGCGAQTDGGVVCWTSRDQPEPVSGISGAVEVEKSMFGGCARTEVGELWCFDGGEGSRVVEGITAFAVSEMYGCFVGNDGAVACSENRAMLEFAQAFAEGAREAGAKVEEFEAIGAVAIPTLAGVEQIAIASVHGEDTICARTSEGTITCAGPINREFERARGRSSRLRPHEHEFSSRTIALPEPAKDLDVAPDHGCVVVASGKVLCWGTGGLGQLGDGQRADSEAPVEVAGITDAIDVDVGEGLSCALRSGGRLSCWGDGAAIPGPGPSGPIELTRDVDDLLVVSPLTCFGAGNQLGCYGVSEQETEVVPLVDLPASELIGSQELACTVPSHGQAQCGTLFSGKWRSATKLRGVASVAFTQAAFGGINSAVTGGDLSIVGFDQLSPPVTHDAKMVAGAIGFIHGCYVTKDGGVACYQDPGLGDWGAAGPGASERAAPVAGVANVVDVVLTTKGTCARHRGGKVSCWGTWLDYDGPALLTADLDPPPISPTDMGLVGVEQLVAGGMHVCARTRDARVFCWGHNDEGQLGVAKPKASAAPIEVVAAAGAVELYAHEAGACVRTEDRRVLCWGSDDKFELGGAGRARVVPVEMLQPPIEQPPEPAR